MPKQRPCIASRSSSDASVRWLQKPVKLRPAPEELPSTPSSGATLRQTPFSAPSAFLVDQPSSFQCCLTTVPNHHVREGLGITAITITCLAVGMGHQTAMCYWSGTLLAASERDQAVWHQIFRVIAGCLKGSRLCLLVRLANKTSYRPHIGPFRPPTAGTGRIQLSVSSGLCAGPVWRDPEAFQQLPSRFLYAR